jgi:hypothetical protein
LFGCDRKPAVEVSEDFKTQLYHFLEEADTLDRMCGAQVLLETKEEQLRRVQNIFAPLRSDWPPGFSSAAKRDFVAAMNAWDSGFAVEKMLQAGVPTMVRPRDGGEQAPTGEDKRAFYEEASKAFANGKQQVLADLHR